MRALWAIAVTATVSACSHESMNATDASDGLTPDVCPLPSAPLIPPECMPDGFSTVNPDGLWHMVGTMSTQVELGAPTTTTIDEVVTIQRVGCGAQLSYEHFNATTSVDNTAIVSECEPGHCPRTTSTTSVCVRASDGALIYRRREHHTSTMPGNTFSSADSMAVLTPCEPSPRVLQCARKR